MKPEEERRRPPKKQPITIEEFNRKLLAEGRISNLPDTASDYDDPDDQPVARRPRRAASRERAASRGRRPITRNV